MERIIKFKAKRLDNKGWVEGDLLHSYENSAIIVPIEGGGAFSVDPSTVCQFTGLKDGKSQDVYENDILEHISNADIKVCIEWREHRYVLKEVGKEILHLALQRTLDDLVVVCSKFDRKEEK